MRLIRLKIDKSVAYKLTLLARDLRTDDAMVQDTYALIRLRGNGIPSDARQQKMMDALVTSKAMSKLSARIHIKKRVQIFKELIKVSYFTACSRLTNPVFATERLMRQFRDIARKVRQSQCESCSLKAGCAFGQQYAAAVNDVTKVIDPDFAKKADPNCPHLPEIDYTNQVNDALKMLNVLMNPANVAQNQAVLAQLQKDDKGEDEEDSDIDDFGKAADELEKMHQDSDPEKIQEDDGEGAPDELEDEDFTPQTIGGYSRGGASSTFSADYYVKVQEKLIGQLMKAGLDLFEMGQVLDALLNKPGVADFKPTDEIGEEHKQRPMTRPSDIVRADKTELAHDEDIVDQKIAKKSLIVEKDYNPTKKRQLLYVLIDVSGSMRTQFYTNTQSVFSRASLATVFASSLLKKVMNDGGYMYLRFFDTRTSGLTVLDVKEDYENVLKKLRDCDFKGAGTNITHALTIALSDIDAMQKELSKATLLIITDADDQLHLTKAQEETLMKREFSVLDVSGVQTMHLSFHSQANYAGMVLKRLSKKYYKCDPNSMDIKKLVSLV